VVDWPDTLGGCWVHVGSITWSGLRVLTIGSQVDLGWEPVKDQDGYKFRVPRVRQLDT